MPSNTSNWYLSLEERKANPREGPGLRSQSSNTRCVLPVKWRPHAPFAPSCGPFGRSMALAASLLAKRRCTWGEPGSLLLLLATASREKLPEAIFGEKLRKQQGILVHKDLHSMDSEMDWSTKRLARTKGMWLKLSWTVRQCGGRYYWWWSASCYCEIHEKWIFDRIIVLLKERY